MLQFRNVYVLRYVYIWLLEKLALILYKGHPKPHEEDNDDPSVFYRKAAHSRLRRISSELECGPIEWKELLLDARGRRGSRYETVYHHEYDTLAGYASNPLLSRNGLGSPTDEQGQNGASRDSKGLIHDNNGNHASHHIIRHQSIVGDVKSTSDVQAHLNASLMANLAADPSRKGKLAPNIFADMMHVIKDGFESVAADSMTQCFVSEPVEPWNFLTREAPPGGIPALLVPLWICGVWVRYCVLLPLRVMILGTGFVIFVLGFSFVTTAFKRFPRIRTKLQQYMLCYFASVFVASWGGFIRYHGYRPRKRARQIYVANHTSLIDVFILIKDYPFSCIGQRHGGIAGALQDLLLSVQNHVWFDREEGRDRKAVQKLVGAHAEGENEPMLVFPEGTCVNDQYCIMFKKGSFELNADVYPIAFKYDRRFADPYWNSSQASFGRHLLDLMTSWAVVCDVYYLPPEKRMEGETPTQFAARVKAKIVDKAGLISINMDGFLKRHRISPRFLEQRQLAFTDVLKRRVTPSLNRSNSGDLVDMGVDMKELVQAANQHEHNGNDKGNGHHHIPAVANDNGLQPIKLPSKYASPERKGCVSVNGEKMASPRLKDMELDDHAVVTKRLRRHTALLLSLTATLLIILVLVTVIIPTIYYMRPAWAFPIKTEL